MGLDDAWARNEGKLVIAVERQAANRALAALRIRWDDAALIGEVVERKGVRLAGLSMMKRTLICHTPNHYLVYAGLLAAAYCRLGRIYLRRHPAFSIAALTPDAALCLSGLRSKSNQRVCGSANPQ